MNRFHFGNTKDDNLCYLLEPHFHITDPFFYLETQEKKRVFLSELDIGAYQETGGGDVEAINDAPFRTAAKDKKGNRLAAMGHAILVEHDVTEVVVPANFPLSLADALRANDVTIVVEQDWCPERIIKSTREIECISENMSVTVGAFNHIERELKKATVGAGGVLHHDNVVLTSERLKKSLEHYFLDHNMDNPEGMVISCGPHAAMPHHEGAGELRAHETIIVDLFPQSRINNYFADMTRTYVKGTPSDAVRRMYETVAASQAAALEAIKPGVSAADLYQISRDIIHDNGFHVGDQGYVHSLGHGLGVAVHESPGLGPNTETALEPGMVITVEPGLYYSEHGGVRIEDTVVVTEDGYTNLTNHPQSWIIS